MTIDDILTAFDAGIYDQELAEQLLQGLIEQEAREYRRGAYACAALTGMLANGVRLPSKDDMAREAFVHADCMVEASAKP